MGVRRLYVEKKPEYAVRAKKLQADIQNYLNNKNIEKVRVLIRYDIENVSETTYRESLGTIFSEPPVDAYYEEVFPHHSSDVIFSVEYLPGQFDQRADSAMQCIQLLNEKENPSIRTATTYVLSGKLSDKEVEDIKNFCINPVDSRESDMEKPHTLETIFEVPEDVTILEDFITMPDDDFEKLYTSLSLAMTYEDFKHIRGYFKEEERRNPSMTEIRVLDTYWSDHCRHTTFLTELKDIEFADGYYAKPIKDTYNRYLRDREELFKGRDDKYVSLMDMALLAMRKLKKDGILTDVEESEEINACSIVVPLEVNGTTEEWLINFKNETHNHPTEIEPFGGAATCLGGAIRDPLSGRTYVYQAMRVTGAANPLVSLKDTLKGKLPQRKIVTTAADGYSSYGNQIGLATGFVGEIYHPDYVAKRMEIGAVMGAARRADVVRASSDPGDVIILLGGRTGRDGCGGATGSSKVHTETSIETAGAEVQKGNPPTERKIQRLFRRKEVSLLIKKCNDFGAGGVSVAIGELAAGLKIDLDAVPKKYAGLDGTEIAISESQERMAVVVDQKDVETFLNYAKEENLEAVKVAIVTKEPRLVMHWRGKTIVDISRAFLDTNGAKQETDVYVELPKQGESVFDESFAESEVAEKWAEVLGDLNVCSQKGLVEMFDASIGAGSVHMPYGGKYQLSPIQTMVAKVPVLEGSTDMVSMMSYGYDPYLSSWSPYHGAVYAVLESVAKIVASGGDYKKIHFTFQEYFKRMTKDKARWSQPFTALLGAYDAQMGFKLASIGGKDSMSGSFDRIDVPPTLVSFAVNMEKAGNIISPEFKKAGNKIILIKVEKDAYHLPNYEDAMQKYAAFYEDIKSGSIVSAYSLTRFGIAEAVAKMSFGNMLGADIKGIDKDSFFGAGIGNIVAEVEAHAVESLQVKHTVIGEVKEAQSLTFEGHGLDLSKALDIWSGTLESVFETTTQDVKLSEKIKSNRLDVEDFADTIFETKNVYIAKEKIATPKVFIPVFPGTNCEYDSARSFIKAGAKVETRVFKNLSETDIRDSVSEFRKAIADAQIIMFPGGFSAGDEPDGSAKFVATIFRNEVLKEETLKLLHQRDGLILGICNGFQALIKLGLLPYADIRQQEEEAPTLAMNTIGRHISKMVYTKVVSNASPWLSEAKLGGIYANPASHGEGKFVANKQVLEELFKNGQVATQYVDLNGNPTMDDYWNANGSYAAIEGILSPDGRVFGKMAHSERIGDFVSKNIYGEQDLKIFESGVKYFK